LAVKLLCHLLDHRRALPVTRNHGLAFSTCKRCGADLVRERGAPWRAVPPGFRVVWKQRGHHDATAHGDALGLIKSGYLSAASGDAVAAQSAHPDRGFVH
jgi:hypothetical protein